MLKINSAFVEEDYHSCERKERRGIIPEELIELEGQIISNKRLPKDKFLMIMDLDQQEI